MDDSKVLPKLAIVVPCYNEERVLPQTAVLFADKIRNLAKSGKVNEDSFVLFCDDGSRDGTFKIIQELAARNVVYRGISLSRNRGHQNVLLAGLMDVKDKVDITISIDCDGQDDINAIDEMVDKYINGAEVVYGIRSSRKTDTWFKRTTAQQFYKLMQFLGAEVVYNHADYRLVSSRVLNAFAEFGEVNLFLRGLFPLVGFKSESVYYERFERLAGESHYPLFKMLGFAWDGITSLSVRPIRLITVLGFLTALVGVGMIGWCLFSYITDRAIPGWASNVMVSCVLGGVQLVSLGVIGEYVGKIYLESKHRPRYIIDRKIGG